MKDLYQAQLAKAQPLEPPVEKKQEPVKRQEQLKLRQNQKGKERDQGYEMQVRSHSIFSKKYAQLQGIRYSQ
jgi:hypothetical protein